MSNISQEVLEIQIERSGLSGFRIHINGKEIREFNKTHSTGGPGPFILVGSHGNVEIALNKASASRF